MEEETTLIKERSATSEAFRSLRKINQLSLA